MMMRGYMVVSFVSICGSFPEDSASELTVLRAANITRCEMPELRIRCKIDLVVLGAINSIARFKEEKR
jgi:hypothetical protein